MEKAAEMLNGVSLTAWVSGVMCGLFGDKVYLMLILLLFVTVDFITGVAVAFSGRSQNTPHGRFSSGVCYNGILRKSLILVVVLVAMGVDRAMGGSNILRDATMLFFIANEGLSILENAAVAGLPLPAQLKNALEKMYSNDKEA